MTCNREQTEAIKALWFMLKTLTNNRVLLTFTISPSPNSETEIYKVEFYDYKKDPGQWDI